MSQQVAQQQKQCLANSTSVIGALISNVLQWDKVENKTAVAVYGVGAVVLLWFSSTIVSAVNSVPLVGYVPVWAAVLFVLNSCQKMPWSCQEAANVCM